MQLLSWKCEGSLLTEGSMNEGGNSIPVPIHKRPLRGSREAMEAVDSGLFLSNTVAEHMRTQCCGVGMAFSSTCFQSYYPRANGGVNGQVVGEDWKNNPWK